MLFILVFTVKFDFQFHVHIIYVNQGQKKVIDFNDCGMLVWTIAHGQC